MPEAPAGPDFQAVDLLPADIAILDEVIRQAELRMQVQIQLALAADARAGVLATIQGTGSAALFVVAAQSTTPIALAPTLAAATVLAVGAVLAAVAARPVDIGAPGTRPRDWLSDIRSGVPLARSRADAAWLLDRSLIDNEKIMISNNRWTTRSIHCLAAAPIVSALALAVVTAGFLHSPPTRSNAATQPIVGAAAFVPTPAPAAQTNATANGRNRDNCVCAAGPPASNGNERRRAAAHRH